MSHIQTIPRPAFRLAIFNEIVLKPVVFRNDPNNTSTPCKGRNGTLISTPHLTHKTPGSKPNQLQKAEFRLEPCQSGQFFAIPALKLPVQRRNPFLLPLQPPSTPNVRARSAGAETSNFEEIKNWKFFSPNSRLRPYIRVMKIPHSFEIRLIASAVAVFSLSSHALHSQTLTLENFDSFDGPGNFVNFGTSGLYNLDNSTGIYNTQSSGGDANGTTLLNSFILSGPGTGSISAPQGGTHYLFNNTRNAGGPDFRGDIWRDSSVSTIVGQIYEVSFYLAGSNTINPALISVGVGPGGAQGELLDGTSAGRFSNPGSATYTQSFQDTGWVRHAYRFQASTVDTDIRLYNSRVTGAGNDFGIDTIELTLVPEPSSSALMGLGVFALLLHRRR